MTKGVSILVTDERGWGPEDPDEGSFPGAGSFYFELEAGGRHCGGGVSIVHVAQGWGHGEGEHDGWGGAGYGMGWAPGHGDEGYGSGEVGS